MRLTKVFLPTLLALCIGCTFVPAKLPTGAVDSVDANANLVLEPAHAFAASLTKSYQSVDPNIHINLTATQLGVLTTLNKSLNIADALEIAYHSKPEQTQVVALNAAVSRVTVDFSSAQSIIPLPAPVK